MYALAMKHSDWDVNLYREHIEPFTIGLTTSHLLLHEHQHLLYGQLIHTYQHIKEMVAISNQVGALYQVGVLYQVGALYLRMKPSSSSPVDHFGFCAIHRFRSFVKHASSFISFILSYYMKHNFSCICVYCIFWNIVLYCIDFG